MAEGRREEAEMAALRAVEEGAEGAEGTACPRGRGKASGGPPRPPDGTERVCLKKMGWRTSRLPCLWPEKNPMGVGVLAGSSQPDLNPPPVFFFLFSTKEK